MCSDTWSWSGGTDMIPPSSTENIDNYLQSLTKEELISLILKLAPQTFFDAINAQFASQKEAKTIFKKVAKAIDDILDDDRLLYEPSRFTEKLLEQLEKLRGLWDKLPSEIGGLLLKLIQAVEQAFENGYLYIERYDRADDYFESEVVNDYIFRFTSSLPSELKSDYIEELKALLEGASYSTFLSISERLPIS